MKENYWLFRSLIFGSIILFGVIAFAATLKLGFLWDDHQMIEQNPYIKTINIENIKHLFLSDPFNQQLNYYRPLQSLSNMIEYPVWKLNPFGYHLVNLAIHCLTAEMDCY